MNALAGRDEGLGVGMHEPAHVIAQRSGGVDDDARRRAKLASALEVARDNPVNEAVGVASQFLTKGDEPWLFMVDTDMVFEPGLLGRLAATCDEVERPIVSGVYWTTTAGGWPLVPVIYDREERDGQQTFTHCREWKAGSVITVDGCGAGCLLIHRSVFETIRKDEGGAPCWWAEITDGKGSGFGEDLSFCLRAAHAGYRITADTVAVPGHVKPVTLTGP